MARWGHSDIDYSHTINHMWINPIIATAIVTAGFGVQAWILITVVGLKVDVCRIKERLGINCKK